MRGAIVALLILALAGPSFAGTSYNNGVANGAGAQITVGTSTPVALLQPRPGKQRYVGMFVCTVAVNCARGTLNGPPSPEPSSTVGFPVAADQVWSQSVDFAQFNVSDGPWDAELDCIASATAGTCSSYEETIK